MEGPARRSTADVVCLGEALALVPALPGPGSPAERAAACRRRGERGRRAGRRGIPAAWVGRLGSDELGAFLLAELERRGVDTGGVETDPTRPTGSYTKVTSSAGDASRAPACATAGPAPRPRRWIRPSSTWPRCRARLAGARIVHTSGITARSRTPAPR